MLHIESKTIISGKNPFGGFKFFDNLWIKHTSEPNIPVQNNENLDIRGNSNKETGKKITQYHTRGYKKLNSLNSLVSNTYKSGIRRSRLRKDIIQNKRYTYKEEILQIEHVAEVDDYSGSAYGEVSGEGAVRTNAVGLQDPVASGVVR
ncbi:hypothetical protein L1887_34801 [Cichorium endivia]|nr:hypothetical protein L1887_34801 [Cichorium endivia]